MFFMCARPLGVCAAGLAPWQFGMTKEQVASFEQFGPYKSFKNGDLETYNAEFDKQKRNVQFFFNVSGLNRIEINLYEARDRDQATAAFRGACEYLRREYGEIKAFYFDLPPNCDCAKAAEAATAQIAVSGKAQLAPVKQPDDLHLFSSYRSNNVMGFTFYSVVLYLDPPNRKDMPMVPPLLAKPAGH